MKNRTVILSLITLGLALVVGLAACERAQEVVQRIKPEVRSTTLEWGQVTAESTEVNATLVVYNPNPITLPLKKVTTDIYLDDILVGSAETVDLEIEKNAEFPIKISAHIDNSKIPAFWAEHIRRSEQSEALIKIGATFDLAFTDFTFPFSLRRPVTTDLLASINKAGPVPLKKTVRVPLTNREVTVFEAVLESLSAEWGEVNEDSTEIKLTALLRNDNPYPLPLPRMAYLIDINGIELASGQTDSGEILAPGSTKQVNTTVGLNTSRMGEWFASHIRNGEKSTFNTRVSMLFQLPDAAAALLGQRQLEIPVWEGADTFNTNLLGGR